MCLHCFRVQLSDCIVAGYYCVGPGVEDYTQFICPAGHYCLTGTVQATQYPCPGQCVVMALSCCCSVPELDALWVIGYI